MRDRHAPAKTSAAQLFALLDPIQHKYRIKLVNFGKTPRQLVENRRLAVCIDRADSFGRKREKCGHRKAQVPKLPVRQVRGKGTGLETRRISTVNFLPLAPSE